VFLQDEIQVGQWIFVAGDRFDRHEEFGGQHSPRVYAVYRVNDALNVKGGVGRGFKAPSLKLLSPEYSVTTGAFVVFGNPNLQPEISTSYEVAMSYRLTRATLQATLFQSDVKDLIQSFCAASCDALRVLNYENVDEARIRGVELSAAFPVSRQIELDLNYTHLDARDLGEDQPLAEKPKHAANVRLSWTPASLLTAQLRGNYYGTQTLYSSEIRYDLPDYTLWGIDLNYQLTKHVKLHLSGDNLTDESLAERSTRFTYVEPGRSYSFGFTGSF
jgi:outer membrane receptor for ferrienterochelin and colicins